MDIQEAYANIEQYFINQIGGEIQIVLGDLTESFVQSPKPNNWLNLIIKPVDRKRITLGGNSVLFRYSALVICEIYSLKKSSPDLLLSLIDKVIDVLSSKRINKMTFSEPNLVFRPQIQGFKKAIITHCVIWDSLNENPKTPAIIMPNFIPNFQFFNDKNTQYLPLI